MAKQRIRVQGSDARLVAALAVLAGVGTAVAGCSPTGTTWIDWVLVVGSVAACVWSAASAPWWAGVALAGCAAALAPSFWVLAVGAVAAIGGLAIGLGRRAVPWSRALVAGVAIQALAHIGNIEKFGFSSLISIVLLIVVAILGYRRRPRRDRRVILRVVLGVCGFVLLAVLGFGVSVLEARADLESGNDKAHEALDHLRDGDFSAAQASFRRAARSFDRADSALTRPWASLVRVVPILAQHRQSATGLVHGAARVSGSAAVALASVDIDALRVVNGRIDTSAIAKLEGPLDDLNASVDSLASTVNSAASPWLVRPLRSRLNDLSSDIAREQESGEDALAAVRHAPAMLGADGRRVYFIAFTTPAEARGLGGFMGNWAEVTITNGAIQLTDFGRSTDLNERGNVGSKTLSGPDDLLSNYGSFLLDDPDSDIVGPNAWQNITVSPDFPAVAQVIAELYPQSGGKKLDGVFAMDVETVARLMQISGPVTLDDVGVVLDSNNVVDYLLREQYLLPDNAERIDALESVARQTVTKLLTSELPSPPDLAKLLSPMTAQGRLSGWAARPEEEEVFDRINMSNRLPAYDSDALAITFNNSVGNKIDDLLDASAEYSVQPDVASGTAVATLTIKLTNTAPASGLPDIVIGNSADLPTGTNSTFLSVYSALPFVSSTLDGEPFPFSVGEDGAYLVSTAFVDIPPGTTSVIVLQLEGGLDLSNGYSLVVRTPPTARPFETALVINGVKQAPISAGAGMHRYEG